MLSRIFTCIDLHLFVSMVFALIKSVLSYGIVDFANILTSVNLIQVLIFFDLKCLKH